MGMMLNLIWIDLIEQCKARSNASMRDSQSVSSLCAFHQFMCFVHSRLNKDILLGDNGVRRLPIRDSTHRFKIFVQIVPYV